VLVHMVGSHKTVCVKISGLIQITCVYKSRLELLTSKRMQGRAEIAWDVPLLVVDQIEGVLAE